MSYYYGQLPSNYTNGSNYSPQNSYHTGSHATGSHALGSHGNNNSSGFLRTGSISGSGSGTCPVGPLAPGGWSSSTR